MYLERVRESMVVDLLSDIDERHKSEREQHCGVNRRFEKEQNDEEHDLYDGIEVDSSERELE